MGSNQVLFDFFGICKDTYIIVLSSSQFVTNVFFKNWAKNSGAFAHGIQFADNWSSTSSGAYLYTSNIYNSTIIIVTLSVHINDYCLKNIPRHSDCFHISWTLCFIPFGSRSTFMWRIYLRIECIRLKFH